MDLGAIGVYFALFIALYFEVFLLLSFLERKPNKKTYLLPKHYPSVTMLVPCFNESTTLAQTVESLLAMDYPKDKLEIMIIDDGSVDNTRSIGEALAAAHAQVSFFHKENGGKYTALNFGIERAKTELVGCLDADSFVAQDAMLEVAKRLETDPSIMALTPSMQVYRPRKIIERMQAVEYTFGIFYKKMFDNLAALNVLPGPFSIYKREVFEKIGMFRHAYNTEDMEIAFRMHANGLKIANAHTAYVYTTVPNTVRKLVKQRTRWSQGFLQNARDYSYMFFNRKYGNFGLLILPFSLVSFFAGLYMAGYTLTKLCITIFTHLADQVTTGVPMTLPHQVNLLYVSSSMLPFLIVTVLIMTSVAILLGQSIANNRMGLRSLIYYFALFGFVAPIWLARAAWGALLAKESAWR